MGAAAGLAAANVLRRVLGEQEEARVIVASAPSQDEMLAQLTSQPDIDWKRVSLFHMDEYVGLESGHSGSFRAYQEQHLLGQIAPRQFYGIRGEADDLRAETARYSALLDETPIDLVCMGIGENGHIAFNDPPVADFHDPAKVKVVELDSLCRQQQVNDGCFASFDDVPTHAITLTCPMLMSGRQLIITVPGKRKAQAVRDTLLGPITTDCPASILRTHESAQLFVDEDAFSLVGT